MPHSLLFLGLLHVALIASLAGLPPHHLLTPPRSFRFIAGLVSGGLTALITVLLPLASTHPGLHIYPSLLVVCALFFGPLAGGLCALVAVVLQPLAAPAPLVEVALQAAGLWSLGCLWQQMCVRWHLNRWLALMGLALTLPALLTIAALLPSIPWPPVQDIPWQDQIPWRYTFGAIVLGGGVELQRSRARSLRDMHQREAELQTAIDASGGGRWEWNVQTRRFSCYGAFYADFGMPQGACDETTWDRWNARRHPDDLQRIGHHLERTMQGQEESYYAEFRMRDEQGQWRWLLSRGRVAERDEAGRPLRLVGLDLDISEHHALQDALRDSEAKYTTFYQTLPDPAGITRLRDGEYLDVNPAFCRMLGHSREEVVGRKTTETGVWQSEEMRSVLIERLRTHGEVKNLPMTACRGDGVRIPGLLSARVAHIGEESCLFFVFHDMSEDKRVRDELVAANRLLQQAGWLARLGVWEHVADGGLAYWSDVCFDIHGLPPNSPLPRDYLHEFVAPAWRDTVVAHIRQALKEPCAWSIDVEIVRTDGRLVWVRVRGESIIENGSITRVRGVMQDIDDRKRASERLRHSEERFARMFRLLPYPIGLSRRSDGRYVDVNPAWEHALGYTRAEAVQSSSVALGIFTAAQRERLIQDAERSGQVVGYEMELTTRSGERRTVLQSMSPIEIHGEACWLFGILDITDRERAEQQVREREELLSLTMSAASLGLWDWNLQTGMVTGDARWRSTLGLPAEGDLPVESLPAACGMSASQTEALLAEVERHTAHPNSPFDTSWQLHGHQPAGRWVRSLGKIVSRNAAGQPQRMVGVLIDVTHQHEQQALLQQLAHYDALTSLPNRVLLAQRLHEGMEQARRHGRQMAVAYLDLDGFKPVNDRLGHGAGDRLLVDVAQRLVRSLRSTDCVARLGGDEFAILLPGLESREDGERLLQALMLSISMPYALDGERVIVTASIGYTLYPQDAADADTLLRHADQAMYTAKQSGRNRFHAFDSEKERALQTQREYGMHIAQALDAGQFELHLQPKVDMRQGRVVGAEALARWRHPERGLLSPAAFLPLIDGSELEVPFGQWVVETALDLLARLQAQGIKVPISVNVSARHLQQGGFADWMADCLARHPAAQARQLDLEITESAALYDIEHVAAELARLRDLGLSVSLDDFGTGYSSLTYLRRLPMDHLKLDQSFVHGMMTDTGDLAIVQGVIGLARSFGYRIVAEGVESVAQGQMLLQMGCPFAQGYCIARPMPADEFAPWMAKWQAPAEWQRSRPLQALALDQA